MFYSVINALFYARCFCCVARYDLQAWMDAQTDEMLNMSIELDEPHVVMETIASVKQQQNQVMDQLSANQQQLEAELQIS